MEWKEKTTTVGELRDLWLGGKYEIEMDTPDGWQPICSWWDKGVLPMVRITAGEHVTKCATNHK